MINTFTTNFVPPPVPPRASARAQMPSRTPSLLWLLSAAVAVQMIISVGGFIYLFQRGSEFQSEFKSRYHDDLIVLRRLQDCDDDSQDFATLLDCKKILDKYKDILSKIYQAEGRVDLRRGETPFLRFRAVAHMLSKPYSYPSKTPNALQWNQEHSLLVNVDYMSRSSTLRIRSKGHYYVYSQVTFSRWHPKIPLAQTVVRRATASDKRTTEDILLKAFCSMKSPGEVCTSFQGGMFQLEEGMELFVNVTDVSLLNFEETATTFGLFMM